MNREIVHEESKPLSIELARELLEEQDELLLLNGPRMNKVRLETFVFTDGSNQSLCLNSCVGFRHSYAFVWSCPCLCGESVEGENSFIHEH